MVFLVNIHDKNLVLPKLNNFTPPVSPTPRIQSQMLSTQLWMNFYGKPMQVVKSSKLLQGNLRDISVC